MSVTKQILEVVEGVSDARCACDVKIPLADILTLSMCAILAGNETIDDIVLYGEMNDTWLENRFGIKKVPSATTLRRVLKLVSPVELGQATLSLMQEAIGKNGDIIAVDGKAIRSTEKMAHLKRGMRILSAYDTQASMTIGQLEVGEKTNEIPVMLELLQLLEIGGRIITADAMHCQRETCKAIIKGGGDYVLQVKKNQPELYEVIRSVMDRDIQEEPEALEMAESYDVCHGRKEHRICYLERVDWLDGKESWEGLNLFIAVDRIVEEKDEVRTERSYYISSLLGTAQHHLQIVREHWKIESMHWMLDVTFHEDACRSQDAVLQMNLNLLRKMALALHKNYLAVLEASGSRKKETRSLKQNMKRCSMSHRVLEAVIMQDITLAKKQVV
jgi:predicted transposase YbfD/YdcC